MPGAMPPSFFRLSAISARPVRAAEPWRSMLSDDGGVGTMSSFNVRRTRSSRGCLAGTGEAGAALRRDAGFAAFAGRRGFDAFFARATAGRFARDGVFRALGRFPETRAGVRLRAAPARAARGELFRLAMTS